MRREKAKRYRWVNVLVIAASVYLLASSVWGTPEMTEHGTRTSVLEPRWLTVAYVVGGIAGILAVALSLKSRRFGRVLVGVGGVVALSGFLAMSEVTPVAVLSMGLPALALLAAAFFLGPMPTPEDEGMRR